jgi:3-hydroxyacyl-[acyl-carrier-protein] dehydratase
MRVSDRFGAEHPALAGHFPGNPLVPGVLLLARISREVAGVLGARVSAIRDAKFHAPLRPDETFEIEFERVDAGGVVRFRVLRGETRIAAGTLDVSAGPAS